MRANHWSVPLCKEDELEHGKEGIALVSRSALIAKAPVLKGSPSATAILLNPNVEVANKPDGTEWPLMTVWVQKKGQVLQVTKRLVQCGTGKVEHSPPVAKGTALVTKPMCTIVLEVVCSAFPQRRRVAKSCYQRGLGMSEHLQNTEYADAKIKKTVPVTRDNRTQAIEAHMQLPVELAAPVVAAFGTQASCEFARYYVSKDCQDQTPKLVHLWLKTPDYKQAKLKYQALPQDKVRGIAWSPFDFAVRAETADAEAIAPLATNQPYVQGERYEIAGVPRDWNPAELYKSLASTDLPWEDIEKAKLLFRKGRGSFQKWIIRAPKAPPAVVFLDQFALVKREAKASPLPQPPRGPKCCRG